MYTGRHRQRTHAGIPHICGGSSTHFYYQWNVNCTAATWSDQSGNNNHAVQETGDNQPTAAGGGLDFEDTNDAATASMMDLTASFSIGSNKDFLMFILMNPESTNSAAYLSDGTSEVFQQTSGNVALFKSPGATNSMNHSATFTISTGEKSLLMIHRTNNTTGTIKLYKNGLVHDPSVTDTTGFDIQNLGSKNDATNWFDGIIYDIGIIDHTKATDKNRDMITDYLCLKHGIQRLG